MTVAALIVAAGRGTRAAGSPGAIAKQYAPLADRPLLCSTLDAFITHAAIDLIQVVIHPEDTQAYATAVRADQGKLLPPVTGGATRQESVRLGLRALAEIAPRCVLIHDAARPFVDAGVISRVLDALDISSGAIAAIPVADTLKKASLNGTIVATVERTQLWRAQTPQGFSFPKILAAHEQAAKDGRYDFTDDAGIAEWAGIAVALVLGSEANTKITTAEDLMVAGLRYLPGRVPAFEPSETRTGTGFDVHRFTDGDHVWLCGVKIPHDKKLEGHSDADVALHALTDALLGAIGEGDIGQHFPPSDETWRGAASHLFLADAARRVAAHGGVIVNVDITLLCEAPRIGPHRSAMQRAIAEILAIEISRVGVKATTTEGLGFTGRREGIAAMATASVRMKIA
ncbi:MAG: bifunctional 2-C-methyl-D-erythritol 4-phosphate cytidylyltransferase/2-C-methyl-D-erythritol 2,4-cyclodiphosphate synthase [Hyphomicrobium sp.]